MGGRCISFLDSLYSILGRALIILSFIVFVFSLAAHTEALNIMTPINKTYTIDEDKSNVSIWLEYNESLNSTWYTLDGKRYETQGTMSETYYSKEGASRYQNELRTAYLDEPLTSSFDFSFDIEILGRGIFTMNLTSLEGKGLSLLYRPTHYGKEWLCLNGENYKRISEAKSDTEYSFTIKGVSGGLYYDYYEVWIDNQLISICNFENRTIDMDELVYDVEDTTAIIKDQSIISGDRYFKTGPGVHDLVLYSSDDPQDRESIKNDSVTFRVVIDGCGNDICSGDETIYSCPYDCKEVICYEDSFRGDTDYNSIIDEKDEMSILNIINNRVPTPDLLCCVDVDGSGDVDQKDYDIVLEYSEGGRRYQPCNLGCIDGTEDDSCSRTKPYFCNNNALSERCSRCGCDEGQECLSDDTCFSVEKCGCADIASENEGLDYDNMITEKDLQTMMPYEGLCESDAEYYDRYDIYKDGCIDEIDLMCIEENIGQETECSGKFRCEDGTLLGMCSVKRPFFCNQYSRELIEECSICGCPKHMTCATDGRCKADKLYNVSIIEEGKKIIYDGRIIETEVYHGTEKGIELEIKALEDIDNLSLQLVMSKGKEDMPIMIDKINERLSRKHNLSSGDMRRFMVPISADNNITGTYEGSIHVLIDGYEFSEVKVRYNIMEGMVVPYIDYEERDGRIGGTISIIALLIAAAIGGIHLYRFKKTKDEEFLDKVEKQNQVKLR